MRRFNVAGACDAERHYMLPPEPRLPQARTLIDEGAYFVLHAPWQSGKTTVLAALAKMLTAEGRYAAVHVRCETAESLQDDLLGVQKVVLGRLRSAAQRQLPEAVRPPSTWPNDVGGDLLASALAAWASVCPRPLVLLFDEVGAVRGEALRAVLRQLRASYPRRPGAAPWSVALCGLRDVRDYKMASGGDGNRLGTSSPSTTRFKSVTLTHFDRGQVRSLYLQHTRETGQRWSKRAIDRAHEVTGGQPWLVNALARDLVVKTRRAGTITSREVELAKERLTACFGRIWPKY